MRIGQAFPSTYLKAADIPEGRSVPVTIDRVDLEQINGDKGKESKAVIYFRGKQKGMILNKTNANTLSAVYGDETDDWAGKPVEIYVAQVQYGAEMVDGLRLKIPRPGAKLAPAPAQKQALPDQEMPADVAAAFEEANW